MLGLNDSVITLRLLFYLYGATASSCIQQSTQTVSILIEPKPVANTESLAECVLSKQILRWHSRDQTSHVYNREIVLGGGGRRINILRSVYVSK